MIAESRAIVLHRRAATARQRTSADARSLKASIRSRLPRGYLFARQNRHELRRIKPWWRRHRCNCCEPWHDDSAFYTPLTKRRIFGLRLYALDWLRLLDPLSPRLCGPLAQDCEQPDQFVSAIELEVGGDARALLDLLAGHGHRAERLTGIPGLVFSVDAFEPVEIRVRSDDDAPADPDEPPRTAAELERIMKDWYGSAFAGFKD